MKYKRILLKLSGEALAGDTGHGIDFDTVLKFCQEIKECADSGVQIGIVVGGGNFWRGKSNEYMDRVTSDYIGMLGTTMNALALGDAFKQLGQQVNVLTAINMNQITEFFTKDKAISNLENGHIVVFGCGTGSPFFTTDTAASLKAAEINADVVIKATKVDGIYDSDPKTNPNAVMIKNISYMDVLTKRLGVMDYTAISLCMDENMPIIVFNINKKGNLKKLLSGEDIGTYVSNEN